MPELASDTIDSFTLENIQEVTDFSYLEDYDAVTFFAETVNSLDPSTNTTKTIRKDIEFIAEWVEPSKYLQLIPQRKSIFNRGI